MERPSVTDGWFHEPSSRNLDVPDAADYVDAATVAIRYASLTLGAGDAQAPVDTGPVTPRSLRDAMGCLATGVCVVTTVWNDEDVAMTANSVTSVSVDPPLILVCIAKTARFHEAVTQAGRWGISVLDATAHELSTQFATPGRERKAQLEHVLYDRGPATGVALIRSSVAQLECETSAIHPGGDHDIVIGEVKAIAQSGAGKHPLLFLSFPTLSGHLR